MASVPRHCRSPRGFTLLELLLAALLGLLLWGVAVRLLMAEGEQGSRLARLARERLWQRRSLDLIRSELRRAERVSLNPSQPAAACPMAGRRAVLHLASNPGPVTYAVGPPPSAIWRGAVLLRCGPAFGLLGEPSTADPLNRVLLDGLSARGLIAELREEGVLRLELEQELPLAGGASQRISTVVYVATPPTAGSPVE
jgi:hypothetical protein